MTRIAIRDGEQVTLGSGLYISLALVWARLTDDEQDLILAATGDAATRFKFGLQTGATVAKERLRSVAENVFGTERADQILA